jgi:TrwC relaxase
MRWTLSASTSCRGSGTLSAKVRGVRRQGLEPRTRRLRVARRTCRLVPHDAGPSNFRSSAPQCRAGLSGVVLPGSAPSGPTLVPPRRVLDVPAAGSGATVLSIGKLGRGQESYYLQAVALGVEDYYLGSGEAPGRWIGDGSRRLGLTGEVDAAALRAVLDGRNPAGSCSSCGTRPGTPVAFVARSKWPRRKLATRMTAPWGEPNTRSSGPLPSISCRSSSRGRPAPEATALMRLRGPEDQLAVDLRHRRRDVQPTALEVDAGDTQRRCLPPAQPAVAQCQHQHPVAT